MACAPLISCLCVTEDRQAFIPWLLWNFDRQTWHRCELVVVDSSEHHLDLPARSDVRTVAAAPGASVPEKRNLAIRQARGDLIAWFDDDDWYHPLILESAVKLIDGRSTSGAGAENGWFIDLFGSACTPHRNRRPLFNGSVFSRSAAETLLFENDRPGACTRWMFNMSRRGHDVRCLPEGIVIFWLCHDRNISNPRSRRRFSHPLADLRADVGADAWGDTDVELASLRRRLRNTKLSQRYDWGFSKEAV
jgi:hypothetical protein